MAKQIEKNRNKKSEVRGVRLKMLKVFKKETS